LRDVANNPHVAMAGLWDRLCVDGLHAHFDYCTARRAQPDQRYKPDATRPADKASTSEIVGFFELRARPLWQPESEGAHPLVAAPTIAADVPIDISSPVLLPEAQELRCNHPRLAVQPAEADFTLDGDSDIDRFSPKACCNSTRHRVEMHVVGEMCRKVHGRARHRVLLP
jgi:hypothetical protein